MSVLVDTNVLLRRLQTASPKHQEAIAAISTLLAEGRKAFYTLQNIAELWNVATRPVANNGLGLSAVAAGREVQSIESQLLLLPETAAIYDEWRRIVVLHAVQGVKVHDARLVAAMLAHGVESILTYDAGDFVRYGINVLHPATVGSASPVIDLGTRYLFDDGHAFPNSNPSQTKKPDPHGPGFYHTAAAALSS